MQLETKNKFDDCPDRIEALKERYIKAEGEIFSVIEEFNMLMDERSNKDVGITFCSYFENLLEMLKSKTFNK